MRVKNIERREYGFREQAESRHAAVIAERNRIARDFHDTFAQGFTGVIVQLEAAKGAAERDSMPESLAHISRAGDLARTCLGEARQSVSALRQIAVSETTLGKALDELLKRMAIGIELKTHLQVEGEPRMLPAVCHDGLLRVTQESLTNTIKHAKAKNFYATLAFSANKVELHLADDGQGFDRQAETDGFGLVGMRERAQLMGAQFRLRAARGRGTEIFVTLEDRNPILRGNQPG